MLPGLKPKAQVAVKPARPVQQEAAKAAPSQEQQIPQQPAKPAPAQTPPAPAPVAKPAGKPAPVPVLAVKPLPSPVTAAASKKPEAKPSAKAAFHIQVGAFKNEANAAALTSQYKDKGYDAFTSKAQKKKR